MSKQIAKFSGDGVRQAVEFVRDLAEGQQLEHLPGGILRLADGRGWRIWQDGSGYTHVTAFGPAECSDVLAAMAQDEAELRANEEQLREQSRQMRELAAPSIRAAR